jgi:hypothetical protein
MKIFESKAIIPLLILAFAGILYFVYKDSGFSDLIRVGDIKKIIPAEEGFEIKVDDGNIVRVSGKTEEILIDKKDHEGISEFIKVWVSPDEKKLCFTGQAMVPMWLYISDIDGSNVVKVAVGKNCSFSPDSTNIAYNNHTTDVSPVNVFVYDIELAKKTNLTTSLSSDDIYRVYNTPTWINDVKIESEYEEIDFNDFTNKKLGISEINIKTGEISDR